MNNQETIETIAKKHNLTATLEELNKILSDTTISIALLGEFSSGKTSLLNRLAGTKLPVGTKPTTKAICIIRAAQGDDANTKYYKSIGGGTDEELSWMDFDEAIQSETDASLLIVEAPQKEWIPAGVAFVDTPGEGSLGSESALTMGYLTQVDAAIFCIPATDGTIHRHVLDFISNPALRQSRSKMVFALTMADQRTSDENERVRQEVIGVLKELARQGRFDETNLDDRVVLVSTAEDDKGYSTQKLMDAMQSFVFGKQQELLDIRRSKKCLALAKAAALQLSERADAMSLDLDGIRAKQRELDENLGLARRHLDKVQRQFAEFRNELPDRIKDAFDANVSDMVAAKSREEVEEVARRTASAIPEAIKRLARQKLGDGDYSINQHGAWQLVSRLPSVLDSIDKGADLLADLAFVALAAGWAAAVPGGAAAAGGAARGAAAVGTKVAAETGKSVAKTVSKAAGAAALGWVSDTLKKINPFSYLADMVTPGLKENAILRFRDDLVSQSDDIADRIWNDYQTNSVLPAQKECDSRLLAIKQIREEREKGRQDFLVEKRALLTDVATLQGLS